METTLRHGIRGLVFLLLLTPLIVSTGTLFPFIVGKALYARTLIEAAFGLWLVLILLNPAYRPPRSWLLLAFGLYLVVTVLAGLTGVSWQRSLWSTYERMQGIVDLAHWFLFLVVVTSVFRSSNDWRILLNANLGASVVMALLGVAQHYDASVPLYEFLKNNPRLDITLGNATYVGAYMMVNVLIGIGLLSHSLRDSVQARVSRGQEGRRRRRAMREVEGSSAMLWWRLFWVAAIALDFWILVLSGTRGAFVGLLAGLAAFAAGYAVWGRLRAARLVALAALGLVVGIALLFVYTRDSGVVQRAARSNLMLARVTAIGLDDASIKGRLSSLSAGLKGFADRPVLGWGPENYVVVFGRYLDRNAAVTETFDQAHNKPVEELATKGVVGLLSYASLWALMLWFVARRVGRQEPKDQLLTLFVGAALTGYFVQNLFLFDTPAAVLQFMLLMGFVVSLDATFEEGAPQPAGRERDARLASDQAGGATSGRRRRARARGSAGPGGAPFLQRMRRLGRAQGDRWGLLYMWVLVVVAPVVFVTAYFINYRPFSAASAIVSIATPAITWEERLGHAQRSIDDFPPLANYPRMILVNVVASNWDNMAEQEKRAGLAMAEREGQQIFESEPRFWRAHVALSQLYQKASSLDPVYPKLAASHFEAASRLAPNTREVARLRALRQGIP